MQISARVVTLLVVTIQADAGGFSVVLRQPAIERMNGLYRRGNRIGNSD